MTLFKSRHPEFDARPAALVAAQLSALVAHYVEATDNCIGDVQTSMESAAFRRGGLLANAVRVLTPSEAPNPLRWVEVLRAWQEARGLLAVARSMSEAPEGLTARAKILRAALEKVTRAQGLDHAVHKEANDDVEQVGQTAMVLHDFGAVLRDVSVAAAIATGAVYFAPALAGAGGAGAAGGLVAPSTVGGTLAGAGKAAVLGATIGGALRGVGTAAGGGSLEQVGAATGAGMRHGAVDGVMGQVGSAANRALLSQVGPQGRAVEAVTRGAVGGAVAVPAGALGGGAKAALDGKSSEELSGAAANGARKGGLKGALRGAVTGVLR